MDLYLRGASRRKFSPSDETSFFSKRRRSNRSESHDLSLSLLSVCHFFVKYLQPTRSTRVETNCREIHPRRDRAFRICRPPVCLSPCNICAAFYFCFVLFTCRRVRAFGRVFLLARDETKVKTSDVIGVAARNILMICISWGGERVQRDINYSIVYPLCKVQQTERSPLVGHFIIWKTRNVSPPI